MMEIMLKGYDVLDELVTSPNFIKLKQVNDLINEKYHLLMNKFNQAKDRFEDIRGTGGFYHPDYKDASRELSELKNELYNKEEVILYFELEKEIQKEINLFLIDLANSISPHIAKPNEMGLYLKGGFSNVCGIVR